MNRSVDTIIFDLGGVLIDWNPRYVYRKIFKTEEETEWFLENVTTSEWNENQDAGYLLHKVPILVSMQGKPLQHKRTCALV